MTEDAMVEAEGEKTKAAAAKEEQGCTLESRLVVAWLGRPSCPACDVDENVHQSAHIGHFLQIKSLGRTSSRRWFS